MLLHVFQQCTNQTLVCHHCDINLVGQSFNFQLSNMSCNPLNHKPIITINNLNLKPSCTVIDCNMYFIQDTNFFSPKIPNTHSKTIIVRNFMSKSSFPCIRKLSRLLFVSCTSHLANSFCVSEIQ